MSSGPQKMLKMFGRPRQDSNLQSSDPKSDALSIRPRGPHDRPILPLSLITAYQITYYRGCHFFYTSQNIKPAYFHEYVYDVTISQYHVRDPSSSNEKLWNVYFLATHHRQKCDWSNIQGFSNLSTLRNDHQRTTNQHNRRISFPVLSRTIFDTQPPNHQPTRQHLAYAPAHTPKWKRTAQCGARTHDPEIKSLVLYRLS